MIAERTAKEVGEMGRRGAGWRVGVVAGVLGLVVAGCVQPAPTAITYRSVSAGSQHTCGVTGSGGVRCWGRNDSGQLGDGTTTQRSVAVAVVGLGSGVAAVAAGDYSTCALTAGGTVKCWGAIRIGEEASLVLTPVDVVGLPAGVTAITAGGFHNCALASGGQVWCWGTNSRGELGDGTTADSATPVQVLGLGAGVTSVSAGLGYTCAVTATGGAKCWGDNWTGMLGDGTNDPSPTPVEVVGLTSGVASVSAGSGHTCAVTTAGAAKCWGSNGYGELGNGTVSNFSLTPVDVTGLTSGTSSIAIGEGHTCARTASGGARCWGWNHSGQLGNNSVTDSAEPVQVSGLTSGVTTVSARGWHTCATTSNGVAHCWGSNSSGELGDGTTADRAAPVNVVKSAPPAAPPAGPFASIDVGAFHSCGVTATGGAQCWGKNAAGQVGDDSNVNRTTPVNVSGLTSGVAEVDAGGVHTCALTTSGGVKCWGSNTAGQLGDGTTIDRATPVDVAGLTSGVSAIAVGDFDTCALTTTGGAKCWGSNTSGQIGDGTTIDRTTPVDVAGLTSGVSAIAVGAAHACAVTSGGGLKCWGDDDWGQLGDGMNGSSGATAPHPTPGDVPGLTSGISAVAAGSYHTCALTTAGGVMCWGRGVEGEVGDGSRVSRPTPSDVVGLSSGVGAISAGEFNSCAVTTGGGAKCWGHNDSGQVGNGTTVNAQLTPTDVVDLSSGVTAISTAYHTCALTTAGRALCWGNNYEGALGDGKTYQLSSTPVNVVKY